MSLRLKRSFQRLHSLCWDGVSIQVNSIKLKCYFLFILNKTKTLVDSEESFIIIHASFAFTLLGML